MDTEIALIALLLSIVNTLVSLTIQRDKLYKAFEDFQSWRQKNIERKKAIATVRKLGITKNNLISPTQLRYIPAFVINIIAGIILGRGELTLISLALAFYGAMICFWIVLIIFGAAIKVKSNFVLKTLALLFFLIPVIGFFYYATINEEKYFWLSIINSGTILSTMFLGEYIEYKRNSSMIKYE